MKQQKSSKTGTCMLKSPSEGFGPGSDSFIYDLLVFLDSNS